MYLGNIYFYIWGGGPEIRANIKWISMSISHINLDSINLMALHISHISPTFYSQCHPNNRFCCHFPSDQIRHSEINIYFYDKN